MKFKEYDLISRAVTEGVEYGYHRAHKHCDSPGEEIIKAEIDLHVMNAICGIMDFEQVDDG